MFDIEQIMRRHQSDSLRTDSATAPSMEYHVFADAVYWTDEFPPNMDWELENAFRVVLNHRTSLLTGEPGRFPEAWVLARQCFPHWIGFAEDRCIFNAEIADRITRIRRVANRCIERFPEQLEQILREGQQGTES